MAFTVDILTIHQAAADKAVDSSARTIESVQTAADNSIILNFDQTLFLRNSTAEYLESIQPRPLGAAYLLAATVIQPWRWLPARWFSGDIINKEIAMDWILVVLATLLFPWTPFVWRRRAQQLAHQYWNQPLVDAIAKNPNAKVVVFSNGFDWIVNPLLAHLPDAIAHKVEGSAIACGFWHGLADRIEGSLARVSAVLGKKAVSQAVAVTDSAQDTALLSAVKTACLFQWPSAMDIPPLSDVYVPLAYSERVKNPGKSHIMKRVIAGHWAFLVIAFSFLSEHFLLNAAGLLLLTISYWCVYEIGYWENDVIGKEYESKPMLSDTFEDYQDKLRLDTFAPWGWAVALAAPALVLLEASNLESSALSAIDIAVDSWQALALKSTIWICFLIAVRATFWMYNQFNEEARIWIYPFLQTQKLFGFAMLVSTNGIGAVLLLSLAVSRWLHYTIYRCGGDRDHFPLNTCCLVLYILGFSAATLSSIHPSVLFTWQAGAAFVYCLVRGIKGFQNVPTSFDLVTQQSVSSAAEHSVDTEATPSARIAVSRFKQMKLDSTQ